VRRKRTVDQRISISSMYALSSTILCGGAAICNTFVEILAARSIDLRGMISQMWILLDELAWCVVYSVLCSACRMFCGQGARLYKCTSVCRCACVCVRVYLHLLQVFGYWLICSSADTLQRSLANTAPFCSMLVIC
jgi:hypothetical protein